MSAHRCYLATCLKLSLLDECPDTAGSTLLLLTTKAYRSWPDCWKASSALCLQKGSSFKQFFEGNPSLSEASFRSTTPSGIYMSSSCR